MGLFKSFLLTIPAFSLIVGCQSGGSPKAVAADAAPGQAVTCAKCQVTYVKLPNKVKNRVVSYTTRKSMECPDCKSAVENFFATGKLEHTCKTCGDNMSICESH